MSIGHEAMHAPQYMQIPLFTTSETRFPKIFSFFGNGFQPSPSTLDFNGGGGDAAGAAGLPAVVAVAGGFAAGAALGAGVMGLRGVAGGLDMTTLSPFSQSVLLHEKSRLRRHTCQPSLQEVLPTVLATKQATLESTRRYRTQPFPLAHIPDNNPYKSGKNSNGHRNTAETTVHLEVLL